MREANMASSRRHAARVQGTRGRSEKPPPVCATCDLFRASSIAVRCGRRAFSPLFCQCAIELRGRYAESCVCAMHSHALVSFSRLLGRVFCVCSTCHMRVVHIMQSMNNTNTPQTKAIASVLPGIACFRRWRSIAPACYCPNAVCYTYASHQRHTITDCMSSTDGGAYLRHCAAHIYKHIIIYMCCAQWSADNRARTARHII